MDVEYLWRAKIREVGREIALTHLASRASSRNRRAARAPKPRTVSAIPLRLLRRAYRQAGALRPAS